MTKFENIGVERQYASRSLREAKREFESSCSACCIKGIHLECLGCSIAFTHELMIGYFSNKRM